MQVKVFQTALNQTVFIADLPYLAHTFAMSPPLHAHAPTFQGQGHLQTLVKVFWPGQVKVFLTAHNQTVFNANLPYLALGTFTMSPPLHVHVPTFQGQCQGHLRILVKVFWHDQVKVFETAQNQRVFNADLPYLVHTMSTPFHAHVFDFQGQDPLPIHTLLQCFQRFMQIILCGNRWHLCSTNISCSMGFRSVMCVDI
jgi:hypothetical protein